MSLRARVVILIGFVLLISMLMGALVAGYEARQVLSAELSSGLAGARQTVASVFEDLPQSDHAARDLRQLVAVFDGNRHVRATLLDLTGRPVLTSRTAAAGRPAPRWFRDMLGAAPAPVSVAVPGRAAGYAAVSLAPVPDIDVAAAWREFLGVALVLTGFAAAGLVLVYLVIGAAFQPLRSLAAQFDRISTGDYSGRVAEAGPSELLGLQRGFNRMAGDLAATTARNRQLADQLSTIQDEERADIARDLHDEIGPHLFAVNMDAEMIAQLNDAGRHAAVPDQVRAIQAAVGHMQRQVRDLLGRLRPTQVTELGLKAAIVDLVRFWTARRPDLTFEVDVMEDDETPLPEPLKDVAFRIVQEGCNNAVRHGDPTTVRITVALEGETLTVSVADDGAAKAAPKPGGLGLIGMRERVGAVGGALSYGPNAAVPGWTTQARFVLEAGGART